MSRMFQQRWRLTMAAEFSIGAGTSRSIRAGRLAAFLVGVQFTVGCAKDKAQSPTDQPVAITVTTAPAVAVDDKSAASRHQHKLSPPHMPKGAAKQRAPHPPIADTSKNNPANNSMDNPASAAGPTSANARNATGLPDTCEPVPATSGQILNVGATTFTPSFGKSGAALEASHSATLQLHPPGNADNTNPSATSIELSIGPAGAVAPDGGKPPADIALKLWDRMEPSGAAPPRITLAHSIAEAQAAMDDVPSAHYALLRRGLAEPLILTREAAIAHLQTPGLFDPAGEMDTANALAIIPLPARLATGGGRMDERTGQPNLSSKQDGDVTAPWAQTIAAAKRSLRLQGFFDRAANVPASDMAIAEAHKNAEAADARARATLNRGFYTAVLGEGSPSAAGQAQSVPATSKSLHLPPGPSTAPAGQ